MGRMLRNQPPAQFNNEARILSKGEDAFHATPAKCCGTNFIAFPSILELSQKSISVVLGSLWKDILRTQDYSSAQIRGIEGIFWPARKHDAVIKNGFQISHVEKKNPMKQRNKNSDLLLLMLAVLEMFD